MRLRVDPGTGAVRLDDEGFDALVRAGTAGAGSVLPEDLAPARDAALALPGMPAALAAVSAPVVEVRVDVAGRGTRQLHRTWSDLHATAVLLAVRDDERQLLATAPQAVAGAVARVVRLGPRRVGARTAVPVDVEVLEDLFHADDLRRLSALAVVGAGWAWTLAVTWAGGERLMSVVDGPEGASLVEPDGAEGWVLEPVDATLLWRRLTTALPSDAELAVALSP